METISKKPTKISIQDLKNLRFENYQEYFYFINDLSTKINDFKMIMAGLLKRDLSTKMGYRCLSFDEFKRCLQNAIMPGTF